MSYIFLTPLGTHVLNMYYARRGRLFEKYRFLDLIRYDETPVYYRQRYLIIIKPKKRDRAFRIAQDEMVDLPVLDFDTPNGIAEQPTIILKVPRVYLIHLWRLQVESKFWLDIDDGRGRRLGFHLCRLVDDFVEEWRTVMMGEFADEYFPEWRSATLEPILFRTFHEIHEHDINSDIVVIERLVKREKSRYERLARDAARGRSDGDNSGGTSLALERVGGEEVTNVWIDALYTSKDLLDVKYQNGDSSPLIPPYNNNNPTNHSIQQPGVEKCPAALCYVGSCAKRVC
jgi:hypothetical protein